MSAFHCGHQDTSTGWFGRAMPDRCQPRLSQLRLPVADRARAVDASSISQARFSPGSP
jgi:hypothetical protein